MMERGERAKWKPDETVVVVITAIRKYTREEGMRRISPHRLPYISPSFPLTARQTQAKTLGAISPDSETFIDGWSEDVRQ